MIHEEFYNKFNTSKATNLQITRISKAVNIMNQTFSALDLWISSFTDRVLDLYEEIEKYQNSKIKVITIRNMIKYQESSMRSEPVVKLS